MSEIKGIDVSENNGDIDWDKVSEDPQQIKFCFVKATEGTSIRDSKTFYNMSKAFDYGIPVGAYHYCYPQGAEDDAKDEAQAFLDCLGSLPDASLGHALDIEVNPESMKPEKLLAWVEEFIAEFFSLIPDQPFYIYSYPSFFTKNFPKIHMLGRFPLWVANYGVTKPLLLNGWNEYKIWQYSCKGRIKGIEGDVDLSCADDSILIKE